MDDIQFWIYIIAGILYFLFRSRKAKRQDEATPPPARPGQRPTTSQQNRPKSFEELLREFTEGPVSEERQMEVEEEKVDVEYKQPKRAYETEVEDGVRRFSDDESRKIYEDSIRMAEGSETAFEPVTKKSESKFGSYRVRSKDEDNALVREIRESLKSPQGARKAIILGEILNRKY